MKKIIKYQNERSDYAYKSELKLIKKKLGLVLIHASKIKEKVVLCRGVAITEDTREPIAMYYECHINDYAEDTSECIYTIAAGFDININLLQETLTLVYIRLMEGGRVTIKGFGTIEAIVDDIVYHEQHKDPRYLMFSPSRKLADNVLACNGPKMVHISTLDDM